MLIWIVIIGLSAFFYRSFAEMAFEFNRQRVGTGFLGVGIMVGTYLILAVVAGMIIISTPELYSNIATVMIMEFSIVGLAGLVTYFVKRAINNSWAKKRSEAEVLDQQTYQARPAQEDILDQ